MEKSNGKKPLNVVFILTDDQGYWSLGCYGNREVIAPNLDRLAANGCVLDNFFCTSPICSPARASIMTGLLPSQHGVVDWLAGGSIDRKEFEDLTVKVKKIDPAELMEPVENLDALPDDATIPFTETKSYQIFKTHEDEPIEYLKDYVGYTDILAENGYVCGLSGKWHLGDSLHPQKSFSFWRTIGAGGTQYSTPEYVRDGKITIGDRYITDIITDDALEFLEENAGKEAPFYLSVHYTAPHSPWHEVDQPKEIWKLYDDCPFHSTPESVELHPDQFKGNPWPADMAERRTMLQGYYTTITAMDRNIGRILDSLEEKGILDDTVVIFTADNGYNLGHHGIWGKGNGTIPYNMFDTSVKVPMIISGVPGMRPGVITELASQYDLFPTLLDLVGIKEYKANEKMPGKSFLGVLTGEEEHFRDEVVVYDEYGPVRMIRTKEYKYVRHFPGGPDELYDLVADPEELVNLVDDPAYRPVKMEMYAKLEEWFERHVYPEHDASKLPMRQVQPKDKQMSTGQCARIEDLTSGKVVFPSF